MAFHCHLTGLAIGPLIKCWIAAKRGSRQSTLKFLFLDFLHQEGSFCVYAVCVCVCQRGEHGMWRFEIDLFLVRH